MTSGTARSGCSTRTSGRRAWVKWRYALAPRGLGVFWIAATLVVLMLGRGTGWTLAWGTADAYGLGAGAEKVLVSDAEALPRSTGAEN